jgi:hypothetical protein
MQLLCLGWCIAGMLDWLDRTGGRIFAISPDPAPWIVGHWISDFDDLSAMRDLWIGVYTVDKKFECI